jgi:dolichol-phosphate mannosyltransferase
MPDTKPELLVVMPVYNEEASIAKVVGDWFAEMDKIVENFVILAIDDGSTDETPKILKQLRRSLGVRLDVISRPNKGHGQSCLQGYRVACSRKIPYVLQIDSDGQCDPSYFCGFWDKRTEFDVIYGRRTREDGLRRIIASRFLRSMLYQLFDANCVDPNVPYRLMSTAKCAKTFERIPPDFALANVALALLLRKDAHVRHGDVPIRFLERYGGEPSVPFYKFAVKALELFRQLRRLEANDSVSASDP